MAKLRKRKLRKLVIVLTVINIVMTLICVCTYFIIRIFLLYKLNNDVAKAGTIGIIGGADGPTAIFITSKPSPYFTTVIFALLSIAGVLYLVFTRKAIE